jgi:ubiquinone/menaquinone biosynthesis C-methylase UbiE
MKLLKIALVLYRENGFHWTALYMLYWTVRFFFKLDLHSLYRKLIDLERKNNLPGYNVPSAAPDLWDLLSWKKGGEEWTVSADWKQSVIYDILLKYIAPGKTILEIGPGAGRWTEVLQPMAEVLIAVDISPKAIDLCRKKFASAGNVQLYLTNDSTLGFIADNSIDAVWSFDVFVHINLPETDRYLAEIRRVLKPGGCAVIHHPKDGGVRGGCRSRMTDAIFASLLEKQGLTLVRQFDSWGENKRFDFSRHGDCVTVFRRS